MNKTQYLWGWLESPLNPPTSANPDWYSFRLLKENHNHRNDEVINELRGIVLKAHKDAKRRLRRLVESSLDPLGGGSKDPTIGYPEKLDIVTLQGYFGEIFAGIVAESFDHFGESGWEVPAYPFRFHEVAFAALENWRQTGIQPGRLPGRTGEDMLAFLRDTDGRIIRSLICEAKCSRTHRSNLISDAHNKASSAYLIPLDLRQLIEILQDYDDHTSLKWVNSLRELYFRDADKSYERIDLVTYICGRSPSRGTSWIPCDRPHIQYTAGRKLVAVEIHIEGIVELIEVVYGVPDNSYE